MSKPVVHPDRLNLIKGLHPFLSPGGQKAATLVLHLGDLLESEHGQKVLQSFSAFGSSAEVLPMEAAPPEPKPYNPYTLFLILVLLLASQGELGNSGGEKSNP